MQISPVVIDSRDVIGILLHQLFLNLRFLNPSPEELLKHRLQDPALDLPSQSLEVWERDSVHSFSST